MTTAIRGLMWTGIFILMTAVLVFASIRFSTDIPNVINDVVPPEGSFDRRYALNPVLAYAHIIPGLIYLLGAPFQMSRRFRSRFLGVHRAMGKVLIPAGLVTGVFAVVIGIAFPFGGFAEASATIVFGIYFITALILAYQAVRAGDLEHHRRWMIRAFAIGIAVGTIRAWGGIFAAFGVPLEDSFGLSFWLAFVMHALVAELWLRWRPNPAPLLT